ncbi:MAG TPA: transcriptional repressor [candidate division WOR-3 bacterium]|uniref:Transcriptional repressor n=1 Tax=candidate division WOR-3 bacterium TaxID=2052148 RepID=A0A9C9ENZ3_UNCW3|nr:transcriptional repressor [candidate division WOR-3 bacterium]
MEKLKSRLEEKGLKPTYPRLKVIEYLSDNINSHPTVEMIYEALKGEIPTISITTIYNTLNAFLENKLVAAETITGTEIRYDIVTTPHHHFLCKICGRIIDIEISCPIFGDGKKMINGHKIEEVHGYFKGICKDCLRNKRKNSKG